MMEESKSKPIVIPGLPCLEKSIERRPEESKIVFLDELPKPKDPSSLPPKSSKVIQLPAKDENARYHPQ
jgi:hypothetical protein